MRAAAEPSSSVGAVSGADPGQVIALLKTAGQTVGCAESLTGGLLVAELIGVPGASSVVRGGVVAYATELKASILGVDPELLAREGAVHPEVARQMAHGVARVTGAFWGVATTGVAGPDAQDGKPVGTVFVAAYAASATGTVDSTDPAELPDSTDFTDSVVSTESSDRSAGRDGRGEVRELRLSGDRQQIRQATVDAALALLVELLGVDQTPQTIR